MGSFVSAGRIMVININLQNFETASYIDDDLKAS